jgi:hypothetical protein
MPEPSVKELAALGGRSYINEVKLALTHEKRWARLVGPELMEYTRWALDRIIDSIDSQKERAGATAGAAWLRSVNSLRGLCVRRLGDLPNVPTSHNREIQAWKEFSAELAASIRAYSPESLSLLSAPYGNMTALQWLESREAKRKVTS